MNWFIEIFDVQGKVFSYTPNEWVPINAKGYIGTHWKEYYPLDVAVEAVTKLLDENFCKFSFRLKNDAGETIPGEIFA